ncbi:MAG: hypothetical protein HZA91_02190 [Verrucomicrobia bacterium]|nr:hypothetical protein [Verrucomicrobiota bacterium]
MTAPSRRQFLKPLAHFGKALPGSMAGGFDPNFCDATHIRFWPPGKPRLHPI